MMNATQTADGHCNYCGRNNCSHAPAAKTTGNANPYQIGETIYIRAWWFPDGRIVRCRVTERSNPDWHNGKVFLTVEPLLKNGMSSAQHCRFIDVAKHAVDPKPL